MKILDKIKLILINLRALLLFRDKKITNKT